MFKNERSIVVAVVGGTYLVVDVVERTVVVVDNPVSLAEVAPEDLVGAPEAQPPSPTHKRTLKTNSFRISLQSAQRRYFR